MKIVAISDTHNKHNQIDKTLLSGDIILHAGDCSSVGKIDEIYRFLKWYGSLDFTHKIFVPGNHDFEFQNNPVVCLERCDFYGVTCLIDKSVTIDGVKIYGSPWQPRFYDWAFNADRGEDIQRHWNKIELDTNILITHGPVYGILDKTPHGELVGCEDLKNKIKELKNLKMWCGGHIHHSYGYKKINNVDYYNASLCDEKYNLVNKPFLIEI